MRVLIIEPYPGVQWRSITRYADGLEASLRAAGVQVERSFAPWWSPISAFRGVTRHWWRAPAVRRALGGHFDIVHLADQALAHHVDRFHGAAQVAVTVHDVLPVTLPGYFTGPLAPLKSALLRRKPLASLHRAALLVAPSAFTARQVTEALGIDPERVTVIPNPADPSFMPIEREDGEAALAGAGVRLPARPRVLSVGHAGSYKNLPGLLNAMTRPELGGAVLIRVGDPLPWRWPEVRTLARAGRLVELGRVPDCLLRAAYAAADLLVQPSLGEGFGYPVLEAMRMRLPVVVSDGGALPELAAGAGVVVPLASPDFPAALAAAIAMVLRDRPFADFLRAAGRDRAELYTIDAVGRRLADAYAALA